MLTEILKALLITSLAGTCLTAVITAAKPITKKVFGYAWHYYIWLAVLAVMILPVRFNLTQTSETAPVVTVPPTENVHMTGAAQNADNAIPTIQTEPKTDIWQTVTSFAKGIIDNRLNILAYLWLIGAIMMFLLNLISYIRLIRRMRKNCVAVSCPEISNFTKRTVDVRIWDDISSPFMAGIFKPALVLPARELTEEQLNNILRHEMTHFKRHDIIYKWFVTLVKCLHWFNPVIWYVAKQINTEGEISCDMAVTFAMNRTQEMSYIDTVLSLLPTGKTKQAPLTTQMTGSKEFLKRRFESIKNKKATSKRMAVLSAVIAVVILGTAVFASGILSDLAADDYTIEITSNGEKIELANKPFIENGEVYLPLEETFEKVGAINETGYIKYDDGKITVFLGYNSEVTDDRFEFEIGKNYLLCKPSSELPNSQADWEMKFAPVLKDSVIYIPYTYLIFTINKKWNINFVVYDKNENLIAESEKNLN